MGPIEGPRNGAMANRLDAKPRSEKHLVSLVVQEVEREKKGANTPLALNISAITPPEFVKGDAPNAPAKKRRTSSVSMFWAPAAPALKAARQK